MDHGTGPRRAHGLDNEADGLDCFATEGAVVIDTADDLDCFATEGVLVIDTADDAIALVDTLALPAVRTAKRGVLAVVWTAARSALPAVRAIARDVGRQRAGGSWVQFAAAACVVLLLGVVILWLIEPADRPATIGAATPSQAPAPVVPLRVQPAPPIARPAPGPPVARALEPVLVSPRAAARAVPRVASAPPPEAEVRPVVPQAPVLPVERAAVVATPEFVRAEPEPEAPRAAVPAAAAAAIVPPSDRSSIERVLQAYRDAYDRLDAPSAAVIWPRVDTRALSRAFSSLAEQDVSFDRCDLAIFGARADAKCTGEIRYVRRVGDQAPRVRRLSWSFALERVSDRWQIAQVTAD